MRAMPSRASGIPARDMRLPDEVYALRSAAAAERMGAAFAAQGAMGGDIAQRASTSQGCCARAGARRAEIVHAAICRSSATGAAQSRAGGFAGIVQLPPFRVDAMLAILVACGAGYYLRSDLVAACGLSRRAAGMAFDDCLAAGLIEPEAISPNYFSPAQAGIEALRDAQGALA